jgi:hypothetical protein
MIDFTEVKLKNLVVHNIGNSLQEEGMKLSKAPIEFKEDIIKELLMKYFLSPFKGEVFYNFFHDTDINLNELYNYASKIFADPDSFFLQTISISKLLYEKSNHHNIKGGEFYLVYFEDCIVNGDCHDAIGLFKSENKDTYIKVYQQSDNFEIEHEQGININKLDKGCLIFNTGQQNGYKVCMVDNTNKSQEAQYWKNEFLKVKPNQDSYFHTENYLHMCKDFCKEVLDKQEVIDKADQIDLLNKSVHYFSKKESFNVKEFETEVIEKPEYVEAFKMYKEDYTERHQIPSYDEFDISPAAVKTNKKFLKSLIKLDKNFHVYVHGNRDYIVKGFDEERGLNYYQLYFNNEK